MGEGKDPYTSGSLIHPERPIALPGSSGSERVLAFSRRTAQTGLVRPETRAELP